MVCMMPGGSTSTDSMAIRSGDYKVECTAKLVSCSGDKLHEVERRQTISKIDRIGIRADNGSVFVTHDPSDPFD